MLFFSVDMLLCGLVGDSGNDVVSSFKYTLLAVILEKLFAMIFIAVWFDHKML